MRKYPKLFIATKAFAVHNGKVLLLRESDLYEDGINAGRFDLPGGRLKPGEHFAEALRREVREETGLEVEIGKPIVVNEWRPVVKGEEWQIVGIFFKCKADSDKVVLSEDHDHFLWIDPARYEEYNLIENLHPVFEEYLRYN